VAFGNSLNRQSKLGNTGKPARANSLLRIYPERSNRPIDQLISSIITGMLCGNRLLREHFITNIKLLITCIPWAVRLSGLENAYSRKLLSVGDFDL